MIQTLVRDFPYVHLGIGLTGNLTFFVGSILFFEAFKPWHHFAVWLFVIGSFGMLVGSIGQAAKEIYEVREHRREEADKRSVMSHTRWSAG